MMKNLKAELGLESSLSTLKSSKRERHGLKKKNWNAEATMIICQQKIKQRNSLFLDDDHHRLAPEDDPNVVPPSTSLPEVTRGLSSSSLSSLADKFSSFLVEV